MDSAPNLSMADRVWSDITIPTETPAARINGLGAPPHLEKLLTDLLQFERPPERLSEGLGAENSQIAGIFQQLLCGVL